MDEDVIERIKERMETEKNTYEEAIGVAHNDFEKEQRKGVVEGMERALTIINEELTRPEREEDQDDEIDLYEEYKEDIRKFFAEHDEVWVGYSHPERDRNGNVWVATHRNLDDNQIHFETLTVEPEEGGQYEVAVRWKGYNGKWSGYSITGDCFMIGHNTGGH